MEQLINHHYSNTPAQLWCAETELLQAVKKAIAMLDTGELRVFEQGQVKQWVKQAILIYLATETAQPMNFGALNAFDKVPLKYNQDNITDAGARIVPPAAVRYGAYIGKNVVLMPSYVNIGAYVGDNTMIDTWATVGSCAQIGANVHISGGAGIGGVLEPLQAQPTIIEDNCFIGARSEVVEGVIVRSGAVLGMGVMLSQSTKIFDRVNNCYLKGEIPPLAVVVPGSLPSNNCHLSAAIIVKYVDANTRAKTSITELLRF